MKFMISAPPVFKKVRPNANLYKHTQWNVKWVNSVTVFFSVFLYVAVFLVWPEKPDIGEIINHPLRHLFLFLFIAIATVFLHEILHLLFSPGGLQPKELIMGFNPKNFMFYVYNGTTVFSWGRAITALLAPLFLLSIVPSVFEFIFKWQSGWLGVLVVFNTSLAANDIIVAGYILFFIPRTALDVQPEIEGVSYLPKNIDC